MSFIQNPTTLRMPYMGISVSNLWTGIGSDKGLYAYRPGGSTLGTYVITEGFVGYKFKIGSTVYSPVFSNVNGSVYWQSGSERIYSTSQGWVISSIYPGREPLEYYDSEKRAYQGDRFWLGSLPSARDGANSIFQPRGVLRNVGTTRTVEFWMPRRVCSTQFGVYMPSNSDVTGNKIMGLPRFVDNEGALYLRSLEKSGGAYSYGSIARSNSKWLIGKLNSDSGWYEGEEPSLTKAVTFQFCQKLGGELERSNIVVRFKDYIQGDERTASYLGEVAIWR